MDSCSELERHSCSEAVVFSCFFSYFRRLFYSFFLNNCCLSTYDFEVERVNLFKNPRLLLLPPDRLNGLLYCKPKLELCFPLPANSILLPLFRPNEANPCMYIVGRVWNPIDIFLTFKIFIDFFFFFVMSLVFFSSVYVLIVDFLSASSY